MVSVAISLASSPAAAPPIPSATTNSDPRLPTWCVRTAGWSDASRRVRSATRNRSSLWSRVLPRSVFAKTSTLMDLEGERRNISGPSLGDLLAGLEARVEGQAASRPQARLRSVSPVVVGPRQEARGERPVLGGHARRVVDREGRMEDL